MTCSGPGGISSRAVIRPCATATAVARGRAGSMVSTLALTSARSVMVLAYWAASSAVIGVLASRYRTTRPSRSAMTVWLARR